jgi:hypothetical protein
VTFRPIVLAAVAAFVVTLLIFLGMRWLLGHYLAQDAALSPPANPLTSTYGRQLPPEPRLQTAPVQELQRLRAAEEGVLTTYAWVDEATGTVRIPIARAMELVVKRGLPARSPAGGSQ